MNNLESKIGSFQGVRVGSDGNGVFAFVRLSGEWVIFEVGGKVNVNNVINRKQSLIAAHGERFYGLMLAFVNGETEIPEGYCGASGYRM